MQHPSRLLMNGCELTARFAVSGPLAGKVSGHKKQADGGHKQWDLLRPYEIGIGGGTDGVARHTAENMDREDFDGSASQQGQGLKDGQGRNVLAETHEEDCERGKIDDARWT